MIPRLSTVKLKELVPIAREFIISNGFNYREYNDEGHAVEHIENDMAGGFYPLLLTPLDTSGEKPFEEFVGEGEKAIEIGMKEILAIEEKVSPGNESIEGLISEMDRLVSSSEQRASKRGIIEAMARVIPQLRHVETGRCLDDRL